MLGKVGRACCKSPFLLHKSLGELSLSRQQGPSTFAIIHHHFISVFLYIFKTTPKLAKRFAPLDPTFPPPRLRWENTVNPRSLENACCWIFSQEGTTIPLTLEGPSCLFCSRYIYEALLAAALIVPNSTGARIFIPQTNKILTDPPRLFSVDLAPRGHAPSPPGLAALLHAYPYRTCATSFV